MPRRSILAVMLFPLFCGPAVLPGAEPFFSRQTVLARQTEGYHTFRVPGLATTPSGSLLIFCDGRVDGGGDIGKMDLVVKRSPDGGKTWEPVRTLFTDKGGKTKIGNVSVVVDEKTGDVHALFCKNLKQAYHITSADGGATFGNPVEITGTFKKFANPWAFFATGHAHGIQLRTDPPRTDRLVVPIFLSEVPRGGGEKRDRFHIGVIHSDDHGKTWQAGGTVPESSHLNENTIYEASDGSIVINARATNANRYVARSADGGRTWSKPVSDNNLRGARCQASSLVTQDSDGKRVTLFTNPAGPGRTNLTVRLSYDDGRTWPCARVIDAEASAYGDLAPGPDGRIHIAYESGKKSAYEGIAVASFNVDWILCAPQATTVSPAAQAASPPAESVKGLSGVAVAVDVDDGDAGRSGKREPGKKAVYIENGYRRAKAGDSTARFIPDLSQTGEYEGRLPYPVCAPESSNLLPGFIAGVEIY
ncbi:MAG: glycoside hydrolase [Opitutaceae bacterium]|nr:glycoside hydrolase [Opitutaceae bacterium]